MQQHIQDETGRIPTLREAGEALINYIKNNEIVIAKESEYHVGNVALDDSQLLMLYRQLKPYDGNFLSRRGISEETLSSPTFSNVFFSRMYQKRRQHL